MHHNYPSDITQEQFEIIRSDLENAKKKTKPRKIDLYDVFCAIWRQMLMESPKGILRLLVRFFPGSFMNIHLMESRLEIQSFRIFLTLAA